MSWAQPGWLVWGFAVLALAAVALLATRSHHHRLAQAFPQGFDRRVLPSAVRVRRALARAATLGALACVVIALAEPLAQDEEVELEAEGVDLVLAVDLSRSMDAQDVDPSRLERARREILDLSERLQGDRVGLVLFAGGAYPRMPLTLDYRALGLLVRELHTKVFQAQGSNLADAIRTSLDLLNLDDATAGQAIVVLSDGEIHRPDEALKAAGEAAEHGVVVYGWLIGSEPAPIPDGEGGFVQDPRTGDRVLTTPDPSTLQAVAERTGGALVRSVAGTSDAEAIYDGEIRRKLRAAVGRRTTRRIAQSAVGLPLGLAVLLGLIGAWLGDGRTAKGLVLLALASATPDLAHAQGVDPAREADAALRAGRAEHATRLFEGLVAENPDDPDLLQRLGVARYRAGDARGAAEAFDRAGKAGDPDALFNAGNAWWKAGLLDRARERYEQALGHDPTHAPAQQNLQAVQQAIELREQAPPPPPEDGQAGDPSESPDGEDGQDSPTPAPGAADDREESPEGSEDAAEDGEQGEDGAATPGEPGEDNSQGAPPQGSPSEDASQDGQPPPDSPSEGAEAGEAPPDDGTRRDKGGGEPTSDLSSLQDTGAAGDGGDRPAEQGEEGATEGGAPQGTDQGAGEDVNRRQAERILDGVEEGRPRVFIPGKGGEPPW